MSNQYVMRALSILLVLGLFGGMVPIPLLASQAAEAGALPEKEAMNAEPVFLPLASRKSPIMKTVFGVEMHSMQDGSGLALVSEAETTWIRHNGLLWSQVEATEGNYNWSSAHAKALEQYLINASKKGMQVVLIVRSTPDWAQKYPGYPCGPIKTDKIGAFANFMYQAVQRYSAAPYNVKYWQIWNEPDVEHTLIPAASPFGCWGENDPYYGGDHFGEVLRQAYPKIKQADPTAQVALGGLLLNCNNIEVDSCKGSIAPNFLEGILRRGGANDGGNYFDIVAFHAYDHYAGEPHKYENGGWNSVWNKDGPAVSAKASFIRSILAQYGFDKPLMNTEGALICGQSGKEAQCLTGDYEITKAYYAAQLFAMAIVEDLVANIWYSTAGWRGSQMFDSQGNPLPVYNAYKFARQTLANATYVRTLSEYAGIQGYEFSLDGRNIWVLWSLDGNDRQIALPGIPAAVWDALGNPVAPNGSNLPVTIKPLYVEW